MHGETIKCECKQSFLHIMTLCDGYFAERVSALYFVQTHSKRYYKYTEMLLADAESDALSVKQSSPVKIRNDVQLSSWISSGNYVLDYCAISV